MMQTQSHILNPSCCIVSQYLADVSALAESVGIHRLLITPATLDSDSI